MCDNLKKKAKKCFAQTWLNDERYKSWIRKVPCDDSLFHCVMCNKNFSCSSSHVSRHADSASHKNNTKENTSPLLNNEDVKSKRKISEIKFKQQWLDIQKFKPWLREVSHDEHSFFCLICEKSFHGGLSHINRHAQSKTHINICKKNEIQTNEDVEMEIDESVLTFEERKKSAEIRYAALIAEKNISHQTAKDILNFFQHVGKDSNVLQEMSMGKTKVTKTLVNVLCPVETDRVVNSIQNTKFSIFIDETSDISNEKWMTFLVRYVYPETLDIRTQLVKLINIDAKDCSAEKLFNAFQNEMWSLQIPFSNIVALSCDNASVMTGKHLSFQKKLQEKCKNLITLSCPCHAAALVAHAACAKIPEHCEEFVRKIANFINSSPKRSAIYREFSECFQEKHKKILKLCETRWLSRHSCIERIIQGWDTLSYFLNEMVVSEKIKSAEYLLQTMNEVDTKAYFLFLKYILNYFNSFNAFFQAEETRVHLLRSRSAYLLLQICRNFLKEEHLMHYTANINFSLKENQKVLDDITVGSECEVYLDELIMQGHIDIVTTVRENCLTFYVTAAEEILKRLPVNNAFLSKLEIFMPRQTFSEDNREISFNDLSFVATTIGGFDENALKEEWQALPFHFTIEERQRLSKLNFDNMWKEIFQHNNSTYSDKYPNLKSVLNAVRALPNSNADAERMFSVLTNVKTKTRSNLSSECVNAICVLKSGLKCRSETAVDMDINAKHLSLMSTEKLYSNPAKPKSSLKLYAAEDIAGPSTSHDM